MCALGVQAAEWASRNPDGGDCMIDHGQNPQCGVGRLNVLFKDPSLME